MRVLGGISDGYRIKEGNPSGAFVGVSAPLKRPCSPHKSPWSGGKHDERLIQCARLLEKMKDSPHIVVNTLHHTKIFGHQTTERRHCYLGIRRSPGRDLRVRFAQGIRNGNGHIIKERV